MVFNKETRLVLFKQPDVSNGPWLKLCFNVTEKVYQVKKEWQTEEEIQKTTNIVGF